MAALLESATLRYQLWTYVFSRRVRACIRTAQPPLKAPIQCGAQVASYSARALRTCRTGWCV